MRKYEFVGIAVGKAVWKEFLEKGREWDTVSNAKSMYHANEIWRANGDKYFIVSYGKRVSPRLLKVGLNVYTRIWLTEEDVRKLEEERRLLKKWDYKVYDSYSNEMILEGRTLTEDFEDLVKIIIRRLKKEELIDYKKFKVRTEFAYLKGDYDCTMRIEVDFALKTEFDLVYFPVKGYDVVEVWTETARAKGMYYKKGTREWGELKIGDYVVKFERSSKP